MTKLGKGPVNTSPAVESEDCLSTILDWTDIFLNLKLK